MHIISIFYQFFSIFVNFDQFRPNFSSILVLFCGVPNFFLFFSINNNLSCLLCFRLLSFYNVLYIFLCQNAHNTNFFTIFLNFCSFLTTFGYIFERLYFLKKISIDDNLTHSSYHS